MMMQKNDIASERKIRTDHHFISSDVFRSSDHEVSPKQVILAPAWRVNLLTAHLCQALSARQVMQQGVVRKAVNLLVVVRPQSSNYSWSRSRRTGNNSVGLTWMKE